VRPGDFLKIFWNENVGIEYFKSGGVNRRKSERGHQVVFTGRKVTAGTEMIRFWEIRNKGGRSVGSDVRCATSRLNPTAKFIMDMARFAGREATSST
jgi:hypothetical protein